MTYFYMLIYIVIHFDVTSAPVTLNLISGASLVSVDSLCSFFYSPHSHFRI